jgi:hypothetical protein
VAYRISVGDASSSFESEYIISRPYQHRLVLYREVRNTAEVDAVVRGHAEFALFAEGIFVVLLCRFGEREWDAVAIPWFPTPDTLTAAGERTTGPAAVLVVTLVHEDLVRALRVIDVPERLAQAFRRVLLELQEATWPGRAEYLALVRAFIGRPGAVDQMLRQARMRVLDAGVFDAMPAQFVVMETVED